MQSPTRAVVRVASIALALSLPPLSLAANVGCSPVGPCSRESPCPNDAPASQAAKDACTANLEANESSDCYGERLAFTSCSIDGITCGGDGRTDAKMTATKVASACADTNADLAACCAKSPGASPCATNAMARPRTFDCSRPFCPADPVPTPAQTKSCEAERSGPCAAEYAVLLDCYLPFAICGSDDKLSPTASQRALQGCPTQTSRYQACLAKAPRPSDAGAARD